jgi:DNA-binding NtrC family response regulator
MEEVESLRDEWSLHVLEEAQIRRAIVHFKNDKIKASQALGISLSCLYRKLGKMRKEGSINSKSKVDNKNKNGGGAAA